MGSGPTGNPDLLGAQNTVEQPISKKVSAGIRDSKTAVDYAVLGGIDLTRSADRAGQQRRELMVAGTAL